jgi:hypothetical protein
MEKMETIEGTMQSTAEAWFEALSNQCPHDDIREWESWMLHASHEAYRGGKISATDFATIMDMVVCF